MTCVVETTGGRVRGRMSDGVAVFKGVPYACDTRFFRLKRPEPARWSGVKDCVSWGPSAPQWHGGAGSAPAYHRWVFDREPRSEDCLVLNVFTSAGDLSSMPVMVFLHGGGFAYGSASAEGLDGSGLARLGVVVVTVNHRLSVLGHLFLPDCEDQFPDAANVGLLDLIAALRWVGENVSAFGGDPTNVTIFGQSGGGSKVAALMAMPSATGLFQRAIIQSSSSMLRMATQEEAERMSDIYLRTLGLNRSNVGRLRDVPVDALLGAVRDAMRANGNVDDFRPVVDGTHLPAQPFEPDSIALSARIPLLLGWCETEQRGLLASSLGYDDLDREDAIGRIGEFVGVDTGAAQTVYRVYEAERPRDSPSDLVVLIIGDYRYRRSVAAAVESRISAGAADNYVYLLKWRTPVLGGILRSPHMLCLPFVFRNVDQAIEFVGSGRDRYRLQEEMSGAWTSFAASGCPQLGQVWPRHTLSSRETMVFGSRTLIECDPRAAERSALELCPPYLPALAEAGLRGAGVAAPSLGETSTS